MVRSGTVDFGSDLPLATADFTPKDRIPKTQQLFMARASQMAVVAAEGALQSSGLFGVGQEGPEDGEIVDLVVRRFYRRAIEHILCARAEGEGLALYR